MTALFLKSMYSRHGSSPKVSIEPISVKLFSLRFKAVREYNLSSPEREQQNSGRYVMSLWTTTDTLYYRVYTKTDSRARARTDRASVHTRERWFCRGMLWSEAAPSQYWKWIDRHISDRFMCHSLTQCEQGGAGMGSPYPKIKNVDKFT